MKLRNKKSGEIVDVLVTTVEYPDNCQGQPVYNFYDSLAELNNEWEDYKEPKPWWYIDITLDAKQGELFLSKYVEEFKTVGNYFETREEAELAVEKLKAWKLLKDECDIKFDGIIRDDKAMLKGVKLSYDRHQVTFDRMRECMDALHLLFGGEE
jgi:hypothetical protein